MARTHVPDDPLYQLNRGIAALVRNDGGTLSTSFAEVLHATTGMPVRQAKKMLHSGLAAAGGKYVTDATGSPVVGVLAGVLLFTYMERDR